MPNYFRPGTYALVPNKHLAPQMKGAPMSVYFILCSHADAEGVCYPGIKRLQDMTGYSRDAVIRALKCLIELKVIERHWRKNKSGDNDTNLYRILIVDDVKGGSADNTPSLHTHYPPSSADNTPGVAYTLPKLTQGTNPLTNRDSHSGKTRKDMSEEELQASRRKIALMKKLFVERKSG